MTGSLVFVRAEIEGVVFERTSATGGEFEAGETCEGNSGAGRVVCGGVCVGMAQPGPHWKWGPHRRERLCHELRKVSGSGNFQGKIDGAVFERTSAMDGGVEAGETWEGNSGAGRVVCGGVCVGMAQPGPHWKWGPHRRERLCHVAERIGARKVKSEWRLTFAAEEGAEDSADQGTADGAADGAGGGFGHGLGERVAALAGGAGGDAGDVGNPGADAAGV